MPTGTKTSHQPKRSGKWVSKGIKSNAHKIQELQKNNDNHKLLQLRKKATNSTSRLKHVEPHDDVAGKQ
jgi:hypothetical protein